MGYNKVIYGGKTLIDLTHVTVKPETLALGVTAYDAAGDLIVGDAVVVGLNGTKIDSQIVCYNKIIFAGKTLVDLTGTTVTPETLADGVTAYDASGRLIVGVATMATMKSRAYAGFVVYDTTTEKHSFE